MMSDLPRPFQTPWSSQAASRALFLALTATALWLTGCGGDDDPVAPPPKVPTAVVVSPPEARLRALDATVQLAATVEDQNGQAMSEVPVTWESSDAAVATVSAAGLVTAVSQGSIRVTATAGTASGGADVVVEQVVAEVAVSPAADTLLALADTARFTAEAKDSNGHAVAGSETTWSSADEAVITVDDSGLVTAVGNGTARVTASSGEHSAGAMVTVEQRVSEVAVSPAADTLRALGDTVRLMAEARDANDHAAVATEVTWSSADDAVATVDTNGLVTAVGDGVASVTASSGGVSGSAALTVAQLAVEMRLSPKADTLAAPGETLRLTAEAHDANRHRLASPRFTWMSSDESVATVDTSGLVTGVAAGSVEVTVAERTAGLSRSAVLLVVEPRAEALHLYEALGGTGWTNSANWGTGAPVDTWHGITTDSEGRITEIDLSNNGLTGAIPARIARIQSLEVLDLSKNGLARQTAASYNPGIFGPAVPGPRGPTVGNLAPVGPEDPLLDAALAEPELVSQRRVGHWPQQSTDIEVCAWPPGGPLPVGQGVASPIPPELGTLPNLRVLDLSYNSLPGSIPVTLGNLESLEFLDLGWNMLEGPIPPELGQLAHLEVLNVCRNKRWDGSGYIAGLTGSIPAELGNLVSLTVLNLGANKLSGSIPAELGKLRYLRQLQAEFNATFDRDNRSYVGGLTGAIPSELGNLVSLESLRLQQNSLTSIAPELWNAMMLDTLNLSWNQLSGSLPSELGQLDNLRFLRVDSNQLSGSLPSELGQLDNLEHLRLNSNQLTGSIPSELGNLHSLRVLGLAGNSLTGSIPSELGSLGSLEDLRLNSNQLTGSIPSELGNLHSLRILGLAGNSLTGPVPSELRGLGALVALWIHDTELAGAMPDWFVDLNLQLFHWQNTQLCAPANDTFQRWLRSIRDHMGGQTCSSAGSNRSSW
ncbi:MAG: Ig-like domain-containing protein [Gammaproteobacteria bacterium]|nr:Ig-like domain-containing protein [Gammaproteobacteria bacterium]